MTEIVEQQADAFRARFAGEVLTSTDNGYDDARSLWNGASLVKLIWDWGCMVAVGGFGK